MSASSATETLNAYGPVSSPHIFDRKHTKSVLSEIFGSRRSSVAGNSKRSSEASSAASSAANSRKNSTSAPTPATAAGKPKKEMKTPILVMPQMRFYN